MNSYETYSLCLPFRGKDGNAKQAEPRREAAKLRLTWGSSVKSPAEELCSSPGFSCLLLIRSTSQHLKAAADSPPTQEGGEMCHKASGHCSAHSLPHFPPLVLWFKDKQTLKMSLQLKHYLYIMSLTSFASQGLVEGHSGRS